MIGLEIVTADEFAPFIGSEFILRFNETEIRLILTEAQSYDSQAEVKRPFALLFSGPAQPSLAQSIYTLTHPATGVLDLFLVPVGADSSQRIYEAVFA